MGRAREPKTKRPAAVAVTGASMKLTFLGTCSGTEPMPGRKHVSFVIEHGGGVYWFDAGEGCSYTAYRLGIDLLAVRAIFITHTHMDHIGGLGNLLWNMRKLNGIASGGPRSLTGKTVKVFIPDLEVWEAQMRLLSGTEGAFRIDYTLDARRFDDGVIYDEDGLRVRARHNRHLGEPAPGEHWRSFSFRIDAGDKSVVFSGDVAGVDELTPLLEHCELLLMETGHHRVEDVCRTLRQGPHAPARLGFIHHGRAVLDDPERELQKARDLFGENVFIADDGMRVEV